MKTLIDKNGKVIHKGTVVHHKEGWYQVMSVNMKRQTVNVGGVFTNRIYEKDVPLDMIYEDRDNWYENWSKSETYKSM